MKDATRFDTYLLRSLLTGYLRDTWLGILLLIVILCIGAGMLTVQLQRNQRTLNDLRGASTQTGTATVTGISSRSTGRSNPVPPITIQLKIGSHRTSVASNRVVGVGQSFQATYRIGRSGTVYVDKLEPLPANQQALVR